MTVQGAHSKFVELERQLQEALPGDSPAPPEAVSASPAASASAHAASA
jgi:hypothetical protein